MKRKESETTQKEGCPRCPSTTKVVEHSSIVRLVRNKEFFEKRSSFILYEISNRGSTQGLFESKRLCLRFFYQTRETGIEEGGVFSRTSKVFPGFYEVRKIKWTKTHRGIDTKLIHLVLVLASIWQIIIIVSDYYKGLRLLSPFRPFGFGQKFVYNK